MSLNKTVLILFLVLTFSSGGNAKAVELAVREEALTAVSFDVNPVMFGFTRNQEEKVLRAAELIRTVVASSEFKQRVLNYTYRGKKQFNDNGGLSNQQIYQRILTGSERMNGLGNNQTMDLELELYSDRKSNTIGYTYPNIIRVYMNRKYFNIFRPHQVADNMMHEWLHKIGFNHKVEATPSRKHSVPYAIGYIVKELALKNR